MILKYFAQILLGCPLSIDPAFNLGDFSVTVTSFCNLLLKKQRTGNNPVMIGPMLVHRQKLFSSYHFFASSLVSLKPSLSGLQAFGTDGEECLYNAFATGLSGSPCKMLFALSRQLQSKVARNEDF